MRTAPTWESGLEMKMLMLGGNLEIKWGAMHEWSQQTAVIVTVPDKVVT